MKINFKIYTMKELLKKLFKNETNIDMKNLLKQGYLIDVRSQGEFSQGNVPGSENIPLDQLSNHLEDLKAKNNIVLFCQSGGRAGVAKSLLEKNGFTNVTNAGGWESVKRMLEN